jgi:hypothetical protein
VRKKTLMSGFCLAALSAGAAAAGPYPEAQISNGVVNAKFYLPDAEKGYYRGTRFDWSGVVNSLQTLGHEYFGVWNDKYDPQLHDAITGPVEEFVGDDTSLGYVEAKPGGTFVRIGVGAVRKPDDKPYNRFGYYDIVDHGKWKVRKGEDWIEFIHELGNTNGYAYKYTKTIRLPKGQTQMFIEHTLENTGKKPIQTSQYNHNFFVIDNLPTGPDSVVKFPFDLKPKDPVTGGLGEVHGGTIVYLKELQTGESFFNEFTGFGPSPLDYDVQVSNKKAGTGVRVQGDRPISRIVYWSIRTTFCPEEYIDLEAAPGQSTTWNYTYDFYKLK